MKKMQLEPIISLSLFVRSLLLPKLWTSVHVGWWGWGGTMAGHMGWVSSSSVCQPTWLLLWQACPRQDHRLGPPVGLQRGFASLPKPIKASPCSTSAWVAPTQPCRPLPQDASSLCPAALCSEITLLFPTVCRVESVMGAVGGTIFIPVYFLRCPRAAGF